MANGDHRKKGGKGETIRRDSGSGKAISRKQAQRRDPKTWEKEPIKRPSKK